MTQVEEDRIANNMICRIFFDIPTIQDQVAKRQLTFIGKVTCNSKEQLLTKLLKAWYNNKRIFRGVLHSSKKSLVHNIVIIVPTVDIYGSLNLWSHLALDDRYWKYLINGIVNTATPPPVPPTSPNTNKAQPPSFPSPTHPSQSPSISPPPRQSTRPSPVPSPR